MIDLAERVDLSQKPAVPQCDSSAPIDNDAILAMGERLCNDTGVVPFRGMVSMLILELYSVARFYGASPLVFGMTCRFASATSRLSAISSHSF